MAERVSLRRLNELLQQVLEERAAASEKADRVLRLHFEQFQQEYPTRPDNRHYDWRQLEPEVTVRDVLEEGLGGCGLSPGLMTEWGIRPRRAWQPAKVPYRGDPQPSFAHSCHQCGRPITQGAYSFGWRDHAGRSECDLGLVPQDMIDRQFHWIEHHPEPFKREEGNP